MEEVARLGRVGQPASGLRGSPRGGRASPSTSAQRQSCHQQGKECPHGDRPRPIKGPGMAAWPASHRTIGHVSGAGKQGCQ